MNVRRFATVLSFVTAVQPAPSHVVAPGDSLSRIAARCGVSVAELAEANQLTAVDHIVVGQRLTLPPGCEQASGRSARTRTTTHLVRAGDSLSRIAGRYGISVKALMRANGLSDEDRIRTGQRLVVPDFVAPRPAASRKHVGSLIDQTAARYGWSARTLKAVAMVESGWNNSAVSNAGALGVMQVLPETGRFVSENVVGRPLDLRDPAQNVEAGVALMNYLYGQTGGDLRQTIASYFQGLRSVRQNGVYEATDRYVDTVLAWRDRF